MAVGIAVSCDGNEDNDEPDVCATYPNLPADGAVIPIFNKGIEEADWIIILLEEVVRHNIAK